MRRKVSEQERVALEQNRLVSEQSTKISLQEGKITEVSLFEMCYSSLQIAGSVTKYLHYGKTCTSLSQFFGLDRRHIGYVIVVRAHQGPSGSHKDNVAFLRVLYSVSIR